MSAGWISLFGDAWESSGEGISVFCLDLSPFFEAAASSDGGARMSTKTTGTNPAATRGFTTGERTGVEVALGCSDSPVQPPPFESAREKL